MGKVEQMERPRCPIRQKEVDYCVKCGIWHPHIVECPVPADYLNFWKRFPFHAKELSVTAFLERYYGRKKKVKQKVDTTGMSKAVKKAYENK